MEKKDKNTNMKKDKKLTKKAGYMGGGMVKKNAKDMAKNLTKKKGMK